MAYASRTQVMNDALMTRDTYISSRAADVIFEPSPLLGAIFGASKMPGTPMGNRTLFTRKPGNVSRQNGRSLLLPVRFNRSTNTATFGGAEPLDTNIDAVGTQQQGVFGNYTDFSARTKVEAWENSGAQMAVDLQKARVDQMFCTISESIEGDMWGSGDGTGASLYEIYGIQYLISTTPSTGTVWGIDRATNSWHSNQATDAAGAFASVGLSSWRTMFTTVSGNGGYDRPTVIMTTPILFNAYTAEAEDIHRITSGREAELGFDVATYRGVPVSYSDNCLAGASYFLNLNNAWIIIPLGSAFQSETFPDPADQAVTDQLRIYFRAQWGFDRYDRQGVVFGFTDS